MLQSHGQQQFGGAREFLRPLLDTVKAQLPTRLIHTETGELFESYQIVEKFTQSQEHANLTQRLKLCTPSERADLAKASMDGFFAYASLSHRWGLSEPLHKDLQARTVFALCSGPGTEKLRGFLTIAHERGLRWAWSDTCCIDKTSSAELQESINSMFQWYRSSALTIVYLSDVTVTSDDILKGSEWFSRGWTLQELLAPRTIQFYKMDWTPYIPRAGGILPKDNDKAIPEFARLLSEAAHVDVKYLNDYTPSTENVREKLRWVAHRSTTKVEDMAYCLTGIFGIVIPVLYGERDRAFSRLQEELLKHSNEMSIFDWAGEASRLNSCLAAHPRCFYEPEWSTPDDNGQVPGVIDQAVLRYASFCRKSLDALRRIFLAPTPGNAVVNGRMKLTVQAHYAVTSVKVAAGPGDSGDSLYRYTLTTTLTDPVTVVTLEKLEEYSFTGPRVAKALFPFSKHLLVRLDSLPGVESDEELDPFSRGKSFVALLLEQQRGERETQVFRRIPTVTRITTERKLSPVPEICMTLVVE